MATLPFIPSGMNPEDHVSTLKLNPEDGPYTYSPPAPPPEDNTPGGGGGTGGGGTINMTAAEHFVVDFPITGLEVMIVLPQHYFTPNEPFIMAMVNGAPTDIRVTGIMENVASLGMVYTKAKFTFKPAAVGKRCHAWLAGGQ